jgi:formamidopyrimidine-DNA glycosylase
MGARFKSVSRRGKYLLFRLQPAAGGRPVTLLGHLGMTGRIYLSRKEQPEPKHAAVIFDLGGPRLIYEDTRYFGRMTLDTTALTRLGPEPLGGEFNPATFGRLLGKSRMAIKVKLLDQAVVAGIGNIYASEALYRARLSPGLPAKQLTPVQIKKLWKAIREVLVQAIECGSTLPLNFGGVGKSDGLFYFGRARDNGAGSHGENLRVYGRAGQPCSHCGATIRRIVQAARSTYFCPHCQRPGA